MKLSGGHAAADVQLFAHSVDAEILADLDLCRRIVALARAGDRSLCEFFLDLAASHLLRVPLERLLDLHLAAARDR